MSWQMVDLTPETFLIQDGDVIVGSAGHIDDKWLVEILWSGPSGDIKGSFQTHSQLRAFVEGVEKAIIAMRDMQA